MNTVETKFEKTIPLSNLYRLECDVEKLNKRATKNNLSPISLAVGDITKVKKTDEYGYESYESYVDIILEGEVPVIEGYVFAGMIDKTDGITVMTGVELPYELRDADPTHCDHCGTKRNRLKIIIIKSVETGEYLRIGTSCAKEFLDNNTAERMIRIAELMITVASLGDDYDEEMGSGGGTAYIDLEKYLTIVSLLISSVGFVSAKKAYESEECLYPTGNRASDIYWGVDSKSTAEFWKEVSDSDKNFAELKSKSAIESIRALGESDIKGNDYLTNLSEVVSLDFLRPKNANLVASIFVATENIEKGSEVKTELEDKAKNSEYIGTVKKREDFKIEVKKIFINEGYYGLTYFNIMEDDKGNSVIWKSSNNVFEEGDKVILKGTVKEHSIYKSKFGDIKTTYLTRCKVVGSLDELIAVPVTPEGEPIEMPEF